MKSSAVNLGEKWGRKTTKKNEELGDAIVQGLSEKQLAPGNSLPAMQGIISVGLQRLHPC